MPSRRRTPPQGPTLATLRAIEDVLRDAEAPLSRYAILKRLGQRVGPPALEAALEYLASHGLVEDEGPGGRVAWATAFSRRAPRRGHARMDRLDVRTLHATTPQDRLRLGLGLADLARALQQAGRRHRRGSH